MTDPAAVRTAVVVLVTVQVMTVSVVEQEADRSIVVVGW